MEIIGHIINDTYYITIRNCESTHLLIEKMTGHPYQDGISYTYETIFSQYVKQIFIAEKEGKNKERSNKKENKIVDSGKCMLVWLDDLNYFFIYNNIIKFTAKSKIDCFEYPKEDIYIPAPYAVDVEDNCYLVFNSNIIIPNFTKRLESSIFNNPYELLEGCGENNIISFQCQLFHR